MSVKSNIPDWLGSKSGGALISNREVLHKKHSFYTWSVTPHPVPLQPDLGSELLFLVLLCFLVDYGCYGLESIL